MGYRGHPSNVLFPFGSGSGYTTWDLTRADTAPWGPDGTSVAVAIRNTGEMAGRQVVQVYASLADVALVEPERWLVGWASVEADPGEEREVRVQVPLRALQRWNAELDAWADRIEPILLTIGFSATDSRFVWELKQAHKA